MGTANGELGPIVPLLWVSSIVDPPWAHCQNCQNRLMDLDLPMMPSHVLRARWESGTAELVEPAAEETALSKGDLCIGDWNLEVELELAFRVCSGEEESGNPQDDSRPAHADPEVMWMGMVESEIEPETKRRQARELKEE